MSDADPCACLTEEEQKFVDEVISKYTRPQILAELKENLGTATHIELATLPIYLYTYYSLNRVKYSGENIREEDLFANKAGGMIMSVAVEEMLHMSLACNILFAMGGTPDLYGSSPGPYPTGLPYHKPIGPRGPDGRRAVQIPLAKLGYEQLWHFLQIEYPEAAGTLPRDRNWTSIGQFYSYIRCLICSGKVYDMDFQKGSPEYQIQHYNYSPNNIDTAHPKSKFNPWGIPAAQPEHSSADPSGAAQPDTDDGKPPIAAEAAVFSNADDSYSGPSPLMTVSCIKDALLAIDTICDQGEGFNHEKYDDPDQHELSHYYKFLTLQAQLEEYHERYPDFVEELPEVPEPPAPIGPPFSADRLQKAGVLFNFPDNPTTAGYGDPGDRALSNLCNGLYQYMLILTETIFKVKDMGRNSSDPKGQKHFFNIGMHRSMIWILDKLIQAMRRKTVSQGSLGGYALAPTFENYPLGSRENGYQGAYEKLIELSEATCETQKYTAIIKTLPNAHHFWADAS